MRTKRFLAILAAFFSLLTPHSAYADIFVSPFTGITFGGDAARRPTFGASATLMGRQLGLEVEGSRTSDLMGSRIPSANLTLLSATLVGNADLVAVGVKPYVLTGVGLLHAALSPTVGGKSSENNLALILGAGLTSLFNDHIGVRADLRYFRRIERAGGVLPVASNLDFFRFTVGLNARF